MSRKFLPKFPVFMRVGDENAGRWIGMEGRSLGRGIAGENAEDDYYGKRLRSVKCVAALVYCSNDIQPNSAVYFVSLQGGEGRRCGGIVDRRQRSRWQNRQCCLAEYHCYSTLTRGIPHQVQTDFKVPCIIILGILPLHYVLAGPSFHAIRLVVLFFMGKRYLSRPRRFCRK